MPVPAADSLNLFSLAFDDFSLNDDEMLMAAVSMFLELGLVKAFNIEKEVSVLIVQSLKTLFITLFLQRYKRKNVFFKRKKNVKT